MRKIKLLLVLLLAITTATVSFGQGQANNWVFGDGIGLNFSTSPPTVTNGISGVPSNTDIMENSTTMSDANGNFLFATSAQNIYAANKTAIGTTLNTDWNTAQGTMVIPVPGSTNKFYLTTVSNGTGPCTSIAPQYTTLQVNGTTGNNLTVLNNNVSIGATPNVSQGQLIVPKADAAGNITQDFWLVYHERNSNKFFVYSVTSTGFTLVSTQAIGPIFPCNPSATSSDFIGFAKANACYSQFAWSYNSNVYLYDFDIKTGTISFKNSATVTDSYGLEFSQNGKNVYVSTGTAGGACNIWQIPVAGTLGTPTNLGALDGQVRGGALQTGPDGNIYCASFNTWSGVSRVNYIGAILNPNGPGTTLNKQYVKTPSGIEGMGLPQFITSLVSSIASIKISGTDLATAQVCKGTTVPMDINVTGGLSTNPLYQTTWLVEGNTLKGNPRSYKFDNIGNIPIQVTVYDLCDRPKTINDVIKVVDYETATATANMNTCPKPTLTGSGATSGIYKWYDKDPTLSGAVLLGVGSTYIGNPSTTYWVQPTGSSYATIGNTGGTGAASTTTSGEFTEFTVSKSIFLNTVNVTPMSWGACSGNISWEIHSGSATGTLVASGTVAATACNVNLPINVNTLLPAGDYFMVYKGGGGGVSDGGTFIATNTSIPGVATVVGTTKWGGAYNGPFSAFKFVEDLPCKIATKIDVGTCCTKAKITSTITPAAICSGITNNFSYTPVTDITSTITWTRALVTGISNAAVTTAQSTSPIVETLINTTALPITVKYKIHMVAGTCSSDTTVSVVVNPTPATPTITGTLALCENLNLGLTSATTTTGTATWAWTKPSASTATQGSAPTTNTMNKTGVALTEAGDYSVNVTINGCKSAESAISKVVITVAPKATVSASQTICSGKAMASTKVTLVPNTAKFDWNTTTIAPTGGATGANPTSATGISDQTDIAQSTLKVPDGTTSGTYTFTITPIDGSCKGTAVTHVVTINPTPATPAPSNTGPYCVGKQIDLDANVATTLVDATNGYAWTGPAGFTASSKTPTIAAAALTPASNAGVYSVTVTKNGCTSAAGTTTVVVNDIPAAPVATAVSVCQDATSPTITVVPNTNLKWYADNNPLTVTTGATQPVISTAVAGTLPSLYVTTTVNGCESGRAEAKITINDLPSFTATAVQATICKSTDAVINFNSGAATYTYTWTTTGTNVSGNTAQATDQSITNITQKIDLTNTNNAGTVQYIITAKSTLGCTSNKIVDIAVDPCPYTPDFTPSKTAVCLDATTGLATITLTNSSSGNVNNWTWDLGGESATTLPAKTGTSLTTLNTPTSFTVTYNTAGTKTIKLEVDGVAAPQKVSKTVTIEVGALPIITVANNNAICGGKATDIDLNTTNVASNFTWVVKSQTDVTGATANATALASPAKLAQTLTNTSTANPKIAGTAVYTVTATGPSTTNCTASQDVTVTVNPLPDVVGTGVTVCGSTTSQSLVTGISANVTPNTIAWTSTLNGVTLSPASGTVSGTTISGTTNTTGATQGTIDYVLTATANSCVGPSKTITSTINPLPVVNATGATAICSGTPNADVITNITSNITGSIQWSSKVLTGTINGFTAGQTVSSGPLNVSSVAVKLSETLTGQGTIEYTLKPSSGSGCVGTDVVIVVTVSPRPVLNTIVTPATICSSTSPGISLSTDIATTITWTVKSTTGGITQIVGSSSTAAVTGGTSGANQTSAQINEKLVSPNKPSSVAGGSTATVTYEVVAGLVGCQSPTQTVTVTVDSCELSPDFTIDKVTVCEGSALVNFTDNSKSASPISSYSWDFDESKTANTVGPHAITYTSSGTKTITLTVQATIGGILKTNSKTKTVEVVALPTIINTTLTSTICDSNLTNITILSQSGTTFTWTVTPTNVNGATAQSVDGQGIIAQKLTLPQGQAVSGTVRYTVTPTLNTCAGTAKDFDVTVEPKPVVTAMPDVSLCSKAALSQTIASTVANTTFTWSRASITNITNAGVSNQATNPISETLVNTSFAPITVKYVIIPTGPGTQACVGKPANLNVIVAPIPTVNSILTNQKVCSGIQYKHNITSPVTNASFTWSRAANANIINAAVTAQTSNPISEVLALNAGVTTAQQATYTISPKGPAPTNCIGRDTNLVLTVNPLPTITASIGKECSGVPYTYTITTQLPSSDITGFTWVRQVNGSITPLATGVTQSTNPIAETLTNTSLTPQAVTYALNATTINGCTNPSTTTHVLTLNPLPVASIITQKAQICIGDATKLQINLQGATTYNVTYSDGGAPKTLSGVSVSPQLIDINPTVTTQYGLVKVEDDVTKCLADLTKVSPQTLQVNSLPTITLSGKSQICEGGTSTVDFIIGGTAVPFKLTFQEKDMKTKATQTSSINNISTSPYKITVAPIDTTVYKPLSLTDNNGCKAVIYPKDSAEVDVVPTPVLKTSIEVGKDTVCDGQPTSIKLTANPYSTFSWTAKASSKVTGALSGVGSIIQQTLKTTATVKGNVRYTITPMNYTCPGTPKDVIIFIRPKTIPNLGVDRSGICKGTKVKLTAGKFNTKGGKYTWSYLGTSSKKVYENRDTLEIELNEDTDIEVSYTDVCDVENKDKAMYKIIEQVNLNYIKGDTCAEYVTTFHPENISPTSNTTNVTTWKWNFGDSKDTTVTDKVLKEATHAYAEAGVYKVNLSAMSDQCPVGSITKAITVIDCSIRTRTAFTPGGRNGQNDTWQIEGIENYPNASVEVFNRWGILVHRQMSGYREPWNGTNTNGELLEDGTYYYVITLNKSKKIVKGYISIFRDNAQ